MEKVKERITHYSLYVTALLKWLAVGALVGGVGGFVGALFHLGVDCATNVRLAHPWILYLLPLGGGGVRCGAVAAGGFCLIIRNSPAGYCRVTATV